MEDRPLYPLGITGGEIGDDLTTKRIAKKRCALKSDGGHPSGHPVGKFRHIEDLVRFIAVAEAW